MICDTATRVLLAVVQGKRLYADLLKATGLSRSTLHHHLSHLRRLGLVTWEDGKRGTLRPLVGVAR